MRNIEVIDGDDSNKEEREAKTIEKDLCFLLAFFFITILLHLSTTDNY